MLDLHVKFRKLLKVQDFKDSQNSNTIPRTNFIDGWPWHTVDSVLLRDHFNENKVQDIIKRIGIIWALTGKMSLGRLNSRTFLQYMTGFYGCIQQVNIFRYINCITYRRHWRIDRTEQGLSLSNIRYTLMISVLRVTVSRVIYLSDRLFTERTCTNWNSDLEGLWLRGF